MAYPQFARGIFIGLLLLICGGGLVFSQVKPLTVMDGKDKLGYATSKIWNPEIFQGGHRRKAYYEGWYFKCASADGETRFALIPGVALAKDAQDAEAFIQYIDGNTGETDWYSFPISAFSYSQQRFEIRIGANYFSGDSVHVEVGEGESRLEADLRFAGLHPWPVRLFSPGIMGPYRFAPGMETCHGLVSLHHRVDGRLRHGSLVSAWTNGLGYCEKDWGSSFPRSYVWMQTNDFKTDTASFMCSIATIPYLGRQFTGFLGFFWYQGTLYRFATYTHAKLEGLKIEENEVGFRIRERKFRVEVTGSRTTSGQLMAPNDGHMQRRISESLDARIQVRLTDRDGKVLFEGVGKNAGLEIVGNSEELMGNPHGN